MAHTPGPWREYESDSNKWIGNAETGEIVCDMPHINYRDDRLEVRWKSNAPLLAAAPDLLEAVAELLGDLDDTIYACDECERGKVSSATFARARQALAKAKGEQ